MIYSYGFFLFVLFYHECADGKTEFFVLGFGENPQQVISTDFKKKGFCETVRNLLRRIIDSGNFQKFHFLYDGAKLAIAKNIFFKI